MYFLIQPLILSTTILSLDCLFVASFFHHTYLYLTAIVLVFVRLDPMHDVMCQYYANPYCLFGTVPFRYQQYTQRTAQNIDNPSSPRQARHDTHSGERTHEPQSQWAHLVR